MDITSMILIVPLFALVIALVDMVYKRRTSTDVVCIVGSAYDLDLYSVAQYIYELDDPDVLKELGLLTDVRRLLIHLEATEGRVRLG